MGFCRLWAKVCGFLRFDNFDASFESAAVPVWNELASLRCQYISHIHCSEFKIKTLKSTENAKLDAKATERRNRIFGKFVEKEYEKTDRLVEVKTTN